MRHRLCTYSASRVIARVVCMLALMMTWFASANTTSVIGHFHFPAGSKQIFTDEGVMLSGVSVTFNIVEIPESLGHSVGYLMANHPSLISRAEQSKSDQVVLMGDVAEQSWAIVLKPHGSAKTIASIARLDVEQFIEQVSHRFYGVQGGAHDVPPWLPGNAKLVFQLKRSPSLYEGGVKQEVWALDTPAVWAWQEIRRRLERDRWQQDGDEMTSGRWRRHKETIYISVIEHHSRTTAIYLQHYKEKTP